LVSANAQLEKAVRVFDVRQPLPWEVESQRIAAFFQLSLALNGLGYPDRAWAKSLEMMEVAQRSSNPAVWALASCSVPEHHLLRGDSMTAQKCAEEAMVFTENMGLATNSATATANHGAALIAQGRYEEGIAEMRRGARGTAAPRLCCHLASAFGGLGRPQEGLQVLDEGFASVTREGAQLYSPWLHRVKGELLLLQDQSNDDEAERCFHTAIEIARQQSARSEELLATMSLARLLAKQGRRDEARRMLTEIYNWFTEGFDTADLMEAKALLDELSKREC